MTCMCGDSECKSCGTAQGTLAPSYNHGARVVIGLDPDGYEVILDFEIKTLGEVGDVRVQTVADREYWVGPYVRLCVTGSTNDLVFGGRSYAGQIQGVIRADLDRYRELFVSRKWIERVLEIWDRYHMNDKKAGTDVQTDFIREVDRRWRKASHEFHCEMLKRHWLYSDCGHEYGSREFLRVIPDDVLDEILDLVEEGAEASNARRGMMPHRKLLSGVSAKNMPAFRKAWADMLEAGERVYSEPAQVGKSTAGFTYKLNQFAEMPEMLRNFYRVFVDGCDSVTIKWLGLDKATIVYEDGTETGEMLLAFPRGVEELIRRLGIDLKEPVCFKITRRGEGLDRDYQVEPLKD